MLYKKVHTYTTKKITLSVHRRIPFINIIVSADKRKLVLEYSDVIANNWLVRKAWFNCLNPTFKIRKWAHNDRFYAFGPYIRELLHQAVH